MTAGPRPTPPRCTKRRIRRGSPLRWSSGGDLTPGAQADLHWALVTIALIGVGMVMVSTLILLSMGDWGLSRVLFEVTIPESAITR